MCWFLLPVFLDKLSFVQSVRHVCVCMYCTCIQDKCLVYCDHSFLNILVHLVKYWIAEIGLLI